MLTVVNWYGMSGFVVSILIGTGWIVVQVFAGKLPIRQMGNLQLVITRIVPRLLPLMSFSRSILMPFVL